MAVIVDMNDVLELSGYLKSLMSRLQSLEKISEEITRNIDKLDTSISSNKQDLKSELNAIKSAVLELKDDVRFVQKTIVQLIVQLKSSVKADDYERFKKRIDLWAPESFVTKNEVEKVLDQ